MTTLAANNNDLILQIPVPDSKNPSKYLDTIKLCNEDGSQCNGIANYFGGLFIWLVRAVAVLAAVVLMVGGVEWMTARGNSGQTEKAQKTISNAIVGLILTLSSYMILFLINPALTRWVPLSLAPVTPITIEVELVHGTTLNIAVGNGNCSPETVAATAQQYAEAKACTGGYHCAWFVSKVLKEAGCEFTANIGAQSLFDSLKQSGFTEVPISDKKPGDVVGGWYGTVDSFTGYTHIAIYLGKKNGVDYCVQSYGTGNPSFGAQKCSGNTTCQNIFSSDLQATTMQWGGTAQCVESLASCSFDKATTKLLRAPSTPNGGGPTPANNGTSSSLVEPIDLAKLPYKNKTFNGYTYANYGTATKHQIILHHTAGTSNTPAFGDVPAPGGVTVKAACQYWIKTNGDVVQLANDTDIVRCEWGANVMGIGIEIVGSGDEGVAFTTAQINAAAKLVYDLSKKYNIPLSNNVSKMNTTIGGVFSHAEVCKKYWDVPKDTAGNVTSGYQAEPKIDPREINFSAILKEAIQLNGGTGTYINDPNTRC